MFVVQIKYGQTIQEVSVKNLRNLKPQSSAPSNHRLLWCQSHKCATSTERLFNAEVPSKCQKVRIRWFCSYPAIYGDYLDYCWNTIRCTQKVAKNCGKQSSSWSFVYLISKLFLCPPRYCKISGAYYLTLSVHPSVCPFTFKLANLDFEGLLAAFWNFAHAIAPSSSRLRSNSFFKHCLS